MPVACSNGGSSGEPTDRPAGQTGDPATGDPATGDPATGDPAVTDAPLGDVDADIAPVDVEVLGADMAELSTTLPTASRDAMRSLVTTLRTTTDPEEAVASAGEILRRSGFAIVSVDGPVVALPEDAAFSDVPVYAEMLPTLVQSVRSGALYPVESVGELLFHLETIDAPMPWPQLAATVAGWGKDADTPTFIASAASAVRALSGERGQVFASGQPEGPQGIDALQLLIVVAHAGGVPVPVPAGPFTIEDGAPVSSGPARATHGLASAPPPGACDALKQRLSTDGLKAQDKLIIATAKWGWGKAVEQSLSYLEELGSLPGGGSGELNFAKGVQGTLKAYDFANKAASYVSLMILLLGATLDLDADKPVTHYKHEDGSTAEEVLATATAKFNSTLAQGRLACYGLAGLDVPKNGPLAGINVRWSLGQDLRPSARGDLASAPHLRPTVASLPKFTIDKTDDRGEAKVTLKPAVEDEPGTGEELKASVTLTAHLEKGELPFSLDDLLLALELNPAAAVIGKTIDGIKSIAVDELLPTATVTIGVRYHGAEPVIVKVDNSVNLILYEIPRVYADLISCSGVAGPFTGMGGYSTVELGALGDVANPGLGALGLPLYPASSPAQDNPISVLPNLNGQQTRFLIAQGDGGPFVEGLMELYPQAASSQNPFGWVTYDVGDGRQGSAIGTMELLLGGNPWPFSDLTGTVYRVANDPRCPSTGSHFDGN